MAAALAASEKLWLCRECRETKLEKARFCKEDAPFPIFEICGESYFRCPVQDVTGASFEALAMFQMYQDGFLPEEGGFLDQPFILIEQVKVIGAIVHEVRKERSKARGK